MRGKYKEYMQKHKNTELSLRLVLTFWVEVAIKLQTPTILLLFFEGLKFVCLEYRSWGRKQTAGTEELIVKIIRFKYFNSLSGEKARPP